MKIELRVAFLIGLCWALAGCHVGRPPRPSVRAPVPPALGVRSSFVPQAALRAQGLLGPVSWSETSTSPRGLADEAFEAALEGDEVLARSSSVAPILAVTGTVTFDLPMSDDERVEYWVEFLQKRGRRSFARWLARSTRYVPLFWKILEEHGLPKDLVFLAMIESGFSPRAYSWAHASGPWQFMPYTGRRFGLKVGFWVDERRDFEKATHAAARYLSRLHAMFDQDWWLAMAAYNAGPGKVRRAIRRTGAADFWRISRTRRLRRETKQYVPKLLAAARISKAPQRYGFEDIAYLPPLAWEVLTVTVATDLATVAMSCGLESKDDLEMLNPELRCGVTPPGEPYALRVPPGAAEVCAQGLATLDGARRMTFRYARLVEGEGVEVLAERFRTTAEAIMKFNAIDADQLAGLGEIVVPVPLAEAARAPMVAPDPAAFRPGVYAPGGQQLVVHRVRAGDSLWRIARRYRVRLRELRAWNGLWRTNNLRLGQRIKVFLRGSRRAPFERAKAASSREKRLSSHRVRAGESPWSIATKYGLSVEALLEKNGLERGVVLQPGQVLRVQ